MSTKDIVKVTTSLREAKDVAAYVKIRAEVLGEARPAFMLQILTQFVWPEILVEIEVVAAAN